MSRLVCSIADDGQVAICLKSNEIFGGRSRCNICEYNDDIHKQYIERCQKPQKSRDTRGMGHHEDVEM